MPEHQGRRRRQSDLPLGRIAAVLLALAAVGVLATLPEPERATTMDEPLTAPSTLAGPQAVPTSGALPDGAVYLPLFFMTADTSIGTAPTRDGSTVRLVRVAAGKVTELRRLAGSDQPRFSGFTTAGDTVVWAESVSADGGAARTSLWRANWRTGGRPASVTDAAGEPNFFGGQYDLAVQGGRVYWAASGPGTTEVRSVALNGLRGPTKRLTGDFTLSAWPWAVSVDGGRGKPVKLVNYDTDTTSSLPTTAAETASCSPVWCRIGVFGEDLLTQLDLARPDGSGRRRIAGSEATPTIVDAALLDRYVPLTTDRGQDTDLRGVGLSVYDITTGQTDLIATDVSNVRASGGMLWWSTGSPDALTWYAIDLRVLA